MRVDFLCIRTRFQIIVKQAVGVVEHKLVCPNALPPPSLFCRLLFGNAV